MDKKTILLDEIYTGDKFNMDDDLSIGQVFERQEKQLMRSKKLSEVNSFLKNNSPNDFLYVVLRIFKDKTPVITVLENLLVEERISFNYKMTFNLVGFTNFKDCSI